MTLYDDMIPLLEDRARSRGIALCRHWDRPVWLFSNWEATEFYNLPSLEPVSLRDAREYTIEEMRDVLFPIA